MKESIAEATGRPSYHPSVLLKLYIYGYLNRVQSSRRLEREAGRNVEVMWLTGRLTRPQDDRRLPQGQWIGDPAGLRSIYRTMPPDGSADAPEVAIDGSKFKAVNTRDKNFTRGKVERRLAQSRRAWRATLRSSTAPTCRSRPKSSTAKTTI